MTLVAGVDSSTQNCKVVIREVATGGPPVVVPEPGEYVADGAAVQAAWALTGDRPRWPVSIAAEPAPDHQPVIRRQYARYATAGRLSPPATAP